MNVAEESEITVAYVLTNSKATAIELLPLGFSTSKKRLRRHTQIPELGNLHHFLLQIRGPRVRPSRPIQAWERDTHLLFDKVSVRAVCDRESGQCSVAVLLVWGGILIFAAEEGDGVARGNAGEEDV